MSDQVDHEKIREEVGQAYKQRAETERRLARYDEAIAILWIGAIARPGSLLYTGFMRRLNAFLAAEPKEGR